MSGKYLDETGLVHLWNKIKDLQSVLGGGGGSKEELFRDVWNTACGEFGRYNKETGFYELNGLTDLTYEDALLVFTESNLVNLNSYTLVAGTKARTLFPFVFCGTDGLHTQAQCQLYDNDFEAITILNRDRIVPNRETDEGGVSFISGNNYLIKNCPNLKIINAVLHPSAAITFRQCPKLEEFCAVISGLEMGLNVQDSPNVSWQSLYYSRIHSTYWQEMNIYLHNSIQDKFNKHPFLGSSDGDTYHWASFSSIGSRVATEEEARLFLNYFKKYFGDPIYTDEEVINKLCTPLDGENNGYVTMWQNNGSNNVNMLYLNMLVSPGDIITRCSKSDLENPNHPWHNIPWEGLDTNSSNNVESDIIATLDIDTIKLMEKSFVDNDLSTAMTYIVVKTEIIEQVYGSFTDHFGHISMIPVCALSPISTYAPGALSIHNTTTFHGVNCNSLPWVWTYPKLRENSSTIHYS